MLAHFAALNSLGMWQAQRCPDAQGVPDSDPVVRQRRDGQQPRAASRFVLCTESQVQVTRRLAGCLVTDGLCAPPRRGFFSIFVYTRIILSGQSFRGSSILSATSCRVGACHATLLTKAKLASGSASKCGAVGRSGTNGSLPAAYDDVLGVHLQSESIILRDRRKAAAGKTNAPSARESVPLRARSRRRRLLETPASYCWVAAVSGCLV